MFPATICSFFASRSILSCLKKLAFLKSENDHEMSQSQIVDKQRYREEETQNIVGLGCIL